MSKWKDFPAPSAELLAVSASTSSGRWAALVAWLESGVFDGEVSGDPRRRLRDRILVKKRRGAAGRKLLGCD